MIWSDSLFARRIELPGIIPNRTQARRNPATTPARVASHDTRGDMAMRLTGTSTTRSVAGPLRLGALHGVPAGHTRATTRETHMDWTNATRGEGWPSRPRTSVPALFLRPCGRPAHLPLATLRVAGPRAVLPNEPPCIAVQKTRRSQSPEQIQSIRCRSLSLLIGHLPAPQGTPSINAVARVERADRRSHNASPASTLPTGAQVIRTTTVLSSR